MAGIKALRRIQLGKETTSGTVIAATAIWRGLGTLEDTTEVTFPEEDVGLLSGTDRAYIAKEGGTLEMDEVEATFEQLGYILEAGVKYVQTGTTDTGGTGKIYIYPMATTAANTIKTYTIEGGDNEGAEVLPYGYVSEFALNGAGGEAVKVSATWMGNVVTPQAFSAGAVMPDPVESILFSKGALFIDATTMGTTTKSNTLMGMELSVPTGWQPIMAANGEIHYTAIKQVGSPEATLQITFEHDASSIAEKVAWKARTRRLIRLNFAGSALTTAGTYTYKTLRIEGGGKWEKFDKIDEQDGNDVVTGTFRFRQSTSGANPLTFTVVNQVTSLP
jgi:hypothetical protein